jgi:hypothetical protein
MCVCDYDQILNVILKFSSIIYGKLQEILDTALC